jgi:ABC-type uncharacterized transport system substrate-binding protein
LLKGLVPALVNIAALYNPEDRTRESEYKQIQEAANSLDLTLRAYKVRSLTEIEKAFALMVEDHAQAVVIFPDVLTTSHQKQLADLTLRAYEVRSLTEIEKAFALMVEDHAQAVVIFPDVLTTSHQKQLADLTLRNRLPAIFGFREFVDMGGLMSYGSSLNGMWRRAALYVDKILKGADPGDLPIDQPTRFELVMNLKTAKTLGITVPPTLLVGADEVTE